MPKLRKVKSEEQIKNDCLIGTIKKYLIINDLKMDDLAKIINCNRSTIYNRQKKPEGFTLGELRKISQILHIPKEELQII